MISKRFRQKTPRFGVHPSHDSNPLSRRHFLGTAVAAATGLTLPRFASAAEKPNSVFNGVRIGCITYSYRSMAKTAEETLKALLD
jgi:hypothetical protein